MGRGLAGTGLGGFELLEGSMMHWLGGLGGFSGYYICNQRIVLCGQGHFENYFKLKRKHDGLSI